MGSWKGLQKRAAELARLDCAVYGVSADRPDRLAKLRAAHGLSFTLLSDPEVRTAEALSSPVSSTANFIATMAIHPTLLTYEKRVFLQPALFVWRRDGTLAHEWRQTESSLTNLYGARGRPDGRQVLEIIRRVLE